jgi:hypothetical protein
VAISILPHSPELPGRFAPCNDKKGKAFSGREGSHSRVVSVGLSGTGYMGNEASRQGFGAHLRVKLHIRLFCYLTTQTIAGAFYCREAG